MSALPRKRSGGGGEHLLQNLGRVGRHFSRLPSSAPLVFIFTLLHLSSTTQSTTRIHTIHWNSSNPLFRIDKTDNIMDINGGNHPWEYDQVNIVCPVYKAGTNKVQQEQYIIYSVTRQEYESCRISQPNPKIVALCNRPHELMYFTITFRSFTPTPGGLEFRPGQDYYFISTSSRNDLHRRVGGGCSSNNMKVVFRVAPDEHQEDDNNHVASSSEDLARPLSRTPKLQFPWSRERDFRRTFSYYNYDSSDSNAPSKKSADYSDDVNEVVKHEASVMPSSSAAGKSCIVASSWTLVTTLVLLLLQSSPS
jgi:ephrin-B